MFAVPSKIDCTYIIRICSRSDPLTILGMITLWVFSQCSHRPFNHCHPALWPCLFWRQTFTQPLIWRGCLHSFGVRLQQYRLGNFISGRERHGSNDFHTKSVQRLVHFHAAPCSCYLGPLLSPGPSFIVVFSS